MTAMALVEEFIATIEEAGSVGPWARGDITADIVLAPVATMIVPVRSFEE